MEPMSAMAAFAAVTLTLGTVPVSVAGQTAIMPKDPSTGDASVLWATDQVSMNTPILMSNGQWWVVKTSRRGPNDSISLALKPPVGNALTTYTVERADASELIWWTGEPHPSTLPPPEPVPEPTPETPGSPIPEGPTEPTGE